MDKRRKRKKAAGLPYRTKQRVLVVDYLSNKEGKKALAAQIIRDLSPLDKRFSKISFYRLFEESRYFEKEGDVRITVKLKE